jgi:WD40 repeat protein
MSSPASVSSPDPRAKGKAKFAVIALYSYSARDQDELSFLKDDVLEILSEDGEDDGWWLARFAEQVGMVPSNYFCVLATTDTNSNPITDRIKQFPKKPSMEKISSANGENLQRKLVRSSNSSSVNGSTNGSTNGSSYDVARSVDLSRLKDLRQEAENKIDALRSAVKKHEESTLSCTESLSTTTGSELDSITHMIQQKLRLQLPKKDRDILERLNKVIMEEETPATSSSRKSYEWNVRESFTTPDGRSGKYLAPSSSEISINAPSSSKNSISSVRPEITPLSLPTVNKIVIESPTASANQNFVLPRLTVSESKYSLIPAASVTKLDSAQMLTPSKPQPTTGFRYPFCRSTVYAPSNANELLRQSETKVPNASLSLCRVHGYDGDINKHGGSVRGKNIVVLRENLLAYPAAALVIVLDTEANTQCFFGGHSEEVSAVTCHPDRYICASGQLGNEGRILVWTTVGLQPGQMLTSHISELCIKNDIRGVSGLNFSGDGRFLIAMAIDEARTLTIFDWVNGSVVASAKAGHNCVYQMGFNPYLFVAADAYDDRRIVSPRSNAVGAGNNNQDSGNETRRGNYALVTCGGKHVKFWTLQQFVRTDDVDVVPSSGFKGRQLHKPKNKQHPQIRYVMEGHVGTVPRTFSDSNYEILCFTTILDQPAGGGSLPRARLLTGTSTGAILIWQQSELEASKMNGQQHASGWQSRGRLLSVINDVHESPLLDIDCTGGLEESQEGRHRSHGEKLLTCGKDGMLSVWAVNRSNDQRSLPLDHLSSVNVNSSLPAELVGEPRVVCWAPNVTNAIVGTTGNFILSALLVPGTATLPSHDGTSTESSPLTSQQSCDIWSISVSPLVQSHFGKVKRVCGHPTASLYATISNDRSLRLWTTEPHHTQTACVVFNDALLCCQFSPVGDAILVGTDKGEILVITCAILTDDSISVPETSFSTNWEVLTRRYVTSKASNVVTSSDGPSPPCIAVNAGAQKTPSKGVLDRNLGNEHKDKSDKSSNLKTRRCDVVEVKYSADGQLVAVGGKDNLIHVLDVSSDWKRVAVCRGHTSCIKSLQFSQDGRTLLSSDAVREVLIWDTRTGKLIQNVQSTKDVPWANWTSVFGWSVQGVFNGVNGALMDGEINAVCRGSTLGRDLIVVGSSNTVRSAVKLFRYPCTAGAVPFGMYGGHACPVLDIKFVDRDRGVVSVGGNDSCIFFWEVQLH